MNKLERIARVSTIFTLMVAGVFVSLNQMQKWALIQENEQEVLRTQQEAAELAALGFEDDPAVMHVMKEREQRLARQAKKIKDKKVVLYEREDNSNELKELQELVVVNKKMLRSYVRDLQDYRKLGVPESNNIVQFAQKKVVNLTLVLAELERQLDAAKSGIAHSLTHLKRLRKLASTNRTSIEQYKKELHRYRNNGLQLNDPKVAFVKTQLSDQLQSMNQLERILDRA